MKRDINLNLLYIALVLLIVLVGTVIFYQTKYEELRMNCERSLDDSNKTITNLSARQKELYDILGELNVSGNREYELASRLDSKNKELESLVQELAYTQQELFEYQQKYDSLDVNNTVYIEILENKIKQLRTNVVNDEPKSDILNDIDEIQIELNNFKNQ